MVTVLDDRVFKDIVKEAALMGIPREIILPLRIFQIPFFNFEDYVKIKNSNISILSNYCLAAHLYHTFGMKFTSPTINMFADDENYLRFIGNLKKYMNEPMAEVENTLDNLWGSRYSYIRGRLDDVEWVFNHDVSFSTAEARWRRGVERFNWDNYIVLMTILSDEMAYKFEALPIQHKIGFYWKNLNLPSVICMPGWRDQVIRREWKCNFPPYVNHVADDAFGVRGVNWMRALLHRDGFVRVE